LEKDIMVLFLQTLTAISLMSFICKRFREDREARTLNIAFAKYGLDIGTMNRGSLTIICSV
jgi:hypothetical protein